MMVIPSNDGQEWAIMINSDLLRVKTWLRMIMIDNVGDYQAMVEKGCYCHW